jgi:hypothetical protein
VGVPVGERDLLGGVEGRVDGELHVALSAAQPHVAKVDVLQQHLLCNVINNAVSMIILNIPAIIL